LLGLITKAYAQTAAPATGSGSSWTMFIPMAVIIVIFYFFLIRPSQKKEKNRKKMIEELQKGDKVVTNSGMYGVIVNFKPEENIVVLKIGEGVKVEFAKSAIQGKSS
jgi:preprotein translocase subunit YajC